MNTRKGKDKPKQLEKDAKSVGNEGNKILLRKTRIAIGATVKWER